MQRRAHVLSTSASSVPSPSQSAPQTAQQSTTAPTSAHRVQAHRARNTHQEMSVNEEQVAADAAARQQVCPFDIYVLFVNLSSTFISIHGHAQARQAHAAKQAIGFPTFDTWQFVLHHYPKWLDDCLGTFHPKNTFACANCGVTQFAASCHVGGNFVARMISLNPTTLALLWRLTRT